MDVLEYFILRLSFAAQESSSQRCDLTTDSSVYTAVIKSYLSYFMPCQAPPSPHMAKKKSAAELLRKPLDNLQAWQKDTKADNVSNADKSVGLACPNLNACETALTMMAHVWLGNCYPGSIRAIINGDVLACTALLIRAWHCSTNYLRYKATVDNDSVSRLQMMTQAITPLMQQSVFALLRKCMHASNDTVNANLMIEVWMKYTRPWRYTYSPERNRESQSRYNDQQWASFVTSNLPFYTHIAQLYLSRAALYDFSFDASAWGSKKSPTDFNRLRVLLELLAGSNTNNGHFTRDTVAGIVDEVEDAFFTTPQAQRRATSLFSTLQFLTQTEDLFYVPLLQQASAWASSNTLLAAAQQSEVEFHGHLARIGQQLRQAKREMDEQAEQAKKRGTSWIVSLVGDGENQGPTAQAREQYTRAIDKLLRLSTHLFGDLVRQTGPQARLPTSPSQSAKLATRKAYRMERIKMLATRRHQPRRSYELYGLTDLMVWLSDKLNDALEPKPWLFPSEEAGQRAYDTITSCAPDEGAFVVWPQGKANGVEQRYTLRVHRQHQDFNEQIARDGSGLLRLEDGVDFADIGELIHFYQNVPYYIDPDGRAYFLAKNPAGLDKLTSSSLQARPKSSLCQQYPGVAQYLLPCNLRALADYRVWLWFGLLLVVWQVTGTLSVPALMMALIGLAVYLTMRLQQSHPQGL
eukprot:TRINITY_DN9197_c0_g1_i1.p1 TRINITY_DN9197_c0_g1~~TRINITY_DN9197_c0_g1_i1.p1  ORF type:complete len:789 (+),score=184.57 TRINITY_DN9197_c0_g1_i1:292-2367(+)